VRSNGETNPATILLVVALAAAGFYGFHVVPLYLDNLEVREACDQSFNVYVLEGEASARDKLMQRLNGSRGIGWHFAENDEGQEVKQVGLGVKESDVTIDFDSQSKQLLVRVEYQRTIQFKPLKTRKTYRFSAQKSGVVGP
jgi:hypothetical protein